MKKYYLHSILWSLYFVVAVLFKSNNLEFWFSVKHTAIMVPLLILLYYSYGRFAVKRYFETKKYVLFILVSVAFLAAFYMVVMQLTVPYFQDYYDLMPSQSEQKEERMVAATLVIAMLVTTVFTVLENRILKEKQSRVLLNEHNEAQLMYLKAQINPHFLFNALNNIYSLAVVNSDKAPKMILNLADLLRYSIYEGQKERVLIKDEILQINKYFELFQATKEEPVDIKFDVLGAIETQRIEPMILIPLVENCIKHGDFDVNPVAFVQITLEVKDDGFRFITRNSFSKANQQKDAVGGVGLENIRKRLKLKYPNSHVFSVMEGDTDFEVFLSINKLNN